MRDDNIKTKFAVASFIASLAFGLLGIFLPPIGIISPSVLIFIGQLLLFTSILLGFSVENNKLLAEITELVKELKHQR